MEIKSESYDWNWFIAEFTSNYNKFQENKKILQKFKKFQVNKCWNKLSKPTSYMSIYIIVKLLDVTLFKLLKMIIKYQVKKSCNLPFSSIISFAI